MTQFKLYQPVEVLQWQGTNIEQMLVFVNGRLNMVFHEEYDPNVGQIVGQHTFYLVESDKQTVLDPGDYVVKLFNSYIVLSAIEFESNFVALDA